MNKIRVKLVVIIYILIALLISFYIFSYNKFGTPEFGDTTLLVAKNLELFSDGSLVIVKKDYHNLKHGDNILFYDSYNATKKILEAKVLSSEKTNESETTIMLDNGMFLSSSYFIGTSSDSYEIYFIGYIISVLSSKIGYMIFVIMPISVIFILELRVLSNKITEGVDQKHVGKDKGE